MPSTVFVAIQCFQCSTMQVKQQKKSSNKWVCAVCNQKQSVRKVFAQGYKAKELRFFVQSFNMSRKSLEEEEHALVDSLPEADDDDDEAPTEPRKKRTDWNEYLDLSDDHRQGALGEKDEKERNGDDFGLKFVTEVPKEMFKRPRLNTSSHARGSSAAGNGEHEDGSPLYKPSFSERSINKQELCLDNPEKVVNQRNLGAGGRVSKGASKWNAYMTQEEKNEPRIARREGLKDDDDDDDDVEWKRAVLGISTTDQRVEDDVHPDFM